jgi:hypothetical protein
MLLVGVAGSTSEAAAEVRYRKTVEVQAGGLKAVRVVNRLGGLRVRGWDRHVARITAVKQAKTAVLGERLRVQVTTLPGGELRVRTYLRLDRVPSGRTAAMLAYVRRQRKLLAKGRRVKDSRLRRDLERHLLGIQSDLEAMKEAESEGNEADGSGAEGSNGLSVPLGASGQVDLELWIPRRAALRARTFKHDINVSGVHGGAHVTTEEGAVEIRKIRGRVVTRAQRGSQRVEGVEGRVQVEGGDSDVTLHEIQGSVAVLLVSGDIDARDLRGARSVLRSVTGNIRIGGAMRRRADYQLASRAGSLDVRLMRSSSIALQGQAGAWDIRGVKLRRVRRRGRELRACVGACGSRLRLSTREGTVTLQLASAD